MFKIDYNASFYPNKSYLNLFGKTSQLNNKISRVASVKGFSHCFKKTNISKSFIIKKQKIGVKPFELG